MEFKGVSFEELDRELIQISKNWVIKNTHANYLEFDLFIEEAIIAHARAIGTLLLSRNENILNGEVENAADKIGAILKSHVQRLKNDLKESGR